MAGLTFLESVNKEGPTRLPRENKCRGSERADFRAVSYLCQDRHFKFL
jgi:hypothetical protein